MVSRQRLRQTLKTRAAATLCALGGLLLNGCARWPLGTPTDVAPQVREAIEARAHAVFEAAVLVKPRESPDADTLAAGLAPLLFCEVAPAATNGSALAPQVVFYRAGAWVWNGRSFPQMSFLWRAGNAPDAPLRGVRITLDSRGLPVIWEGLDSAARVGAEAVRIVFVAQSLEARARRAFGAPLTGRRYAVEADATRPATVVARVLDDGPALMGPEVYLTHAGEITAITCRCMPPQARRLSATAWYALQPLPADEAEAATVLAATPDLGATLRLPPDF